MIQYTAIASRMPEIRDRDYEPGIKAVRTTLIPVTGARPSEMTLESPLNLVNT